MGDILNFPQLKPGKELPQPQETAKPTREQTALDLEQLSKQGGEADAAMKSWRRSIPREDRERMARNMDALLREYRIRPKDLAWEEMGYRDRASFGRDLDRMTLKETAKLHKPLVAHTTKWRELLDLVHSACMHKHQHVTLEALAEKLTRGTRFHPIRKTHTREEKLIYALKLMANKIDEEYGLLEKYLRIADLRAAHYGTYMRDYNDTEVNQWELKSLDIKPAEFFTDIPDAIRPLFERHLGSYNCANWEQLLSSIPEEFRVLFEGYRQDIERWNANFDPRLTLFDYDYRSAAHDNWAFSDVEYMPRWFIGNHDYDKLRLISRYTRDYESGSVDPLMTKDKLQGASCAYLVLFPSEDLSRMVPYLLECMEEGSECESLYEGSFHLFWDLYFPPTQDDTECVSSDLLTRIETGLSSIAESWRKTANDLLMHPYFAWDASRDSQINDMLTQLTSTPIDNN